MGRVYTVPLQLTAVTGQIDLFDLAPADDKPIRLLAVYINQSTELGDSQEEQLGIQYIRGFATVGSGGSSVTPTPLDPGDAAASFTARTGDTTIAVVGGGSTTHLHADTWNVRGPYVYLVPPEMRMVCSQGQTRLVVRTTGAPADSITISATAYIEEIG